MKFKNIIIASLLLLSLAACKQEYIVYNDVSRIHFGPEPEQIYYNYYELADTTKSYTFFYEAAEVTQDTVFFNLYATGGVEETDRTFKLKQVSAEGVANAQAGVHYQPFDSPSLADKYVVKAGTVHTRVPIVLLRDPSLKEGSVTLKLEVEANENFELGIATNLWRKVHITDKLSKPARWSDVTWGPYSIAKHTFFMEVTGRKWDNQFFDEILSNSDIVQDWKTILKAALIDYNQKNPENPLKDEDDNLIHIP